VFHSLLQLAIGGFLFSECLACRWGQLHKAFRLQSGCRATINKACGDGGLERHSFRSEIDEALRAGEARGLAGLVGARLCLAVNLCDNNARVSGLSKGGGQCCRDKSAGQGEFLKDMVLFLYDGMAFFFKGY
jgi:hypothetical protein